MVRISSQKVNVPTCSEFNAYLNSPGWSDSKGTPYPNWAAGTEFAVRFKSSPYQPSVQRVTGGFEGTVREVRARFFVRLRVSRLEWAPPQQLSAGCIEAKRAWAEAVETHERDHGIDIDRIIRTATAQPLVGPFTGRGHTEVAARTDLQAKIRLALEAKARKLHQAIKDKEKEYHEKNLVPLLDCGKCPSNPLVNA